MCSVCIIMDSWLHIMDSWLQTAKLFVSSPWAVLCLMATIVCARQASIIVRARGLLGSFMRCGWRTQQRPSLTTIWRAVATEWCTSSPRWASSSASIRI